MTATLVQQTAIHIYVKSILYAYCIQNTDSDVSLQSPAIY